MTPIDAGALTSDAEGSGGIAALVHTSLESAPPSLCSSMQSDRTDDSAGITTFGRTPPPVKRQVSDCDVIYCVEYAPCVCSLI